MIRNLGCICDESDDLLFCFFRVRWRGRIDDLLVNVGDSRCLTSILSSDLQKEGGQEEDSFWNVYESKCSKIRRFDSLRMDLPALDCAYQIGKIRDSPLATSRRFSRERSPGSFQLNSKSLPDCRAGCRADFGGCSTSIPSKETKR